MSKSVHIFLVSADGVRHEICDFEPMSGEFSWQGRWEPFDFARLEFMVCEPEKESEGLEIVKAMKQGEPFNFEAHLSNDAVVTRSFTFWELLDATFIHDPTQRYIVRLRA